MPFSPKLIRIVRRLILSLAILATLIALAIVIENWRGNRAWKAIKEHYAAKGDPLDVLPPPLPAVPDEKNFFCTPVLARTLIQQKNPFGNTGLYASPPTETNPYLDLVYVAKNVASAKKRPEPSNKEEAYRILHDAFAPIEPALMELRKAAIERPYSQIVHSKPLTVYNLFSDQNINCDAALSLSKSIGIHAGLMRDERKFDIAYSDIMAELKLAYGFIENANTLLETLVGAAMFSLANQTIWEGYQNHEWTENQLAEFQHQIGRCQPMKSIRRVFICERNTVFNLNPDVFLTNDFFLERTPWWAKLPGWLQQNKASIPKGWDKFVEVIESHSTPHFREHLDSIKVRPQKNRWNPYVQLAHLAQRNIGPLVVDLVQDTSGFTLAATACALERHWLAHGSYPETLAELIPTYIDKVPLDIVNGDPLRYRRTDNGKFLLYSLGLDGKDDGGYPDKDWAWPQAIATR